jgi:hypothetical protein
MKKLSYESLIKNPANLKRLTGMGEREFRDLVIKAKAVWDKRIVAVKKVSGRPWGLPTLEDHILALLIYYRFYIPHTFLGLMFGVDDSVLCRSFRRIEPILKDVTILKKERQLKRDDLQTIIVDVTEQVIQRPQKKQKSYYSGKKKKHTLKTEIQVTSKGEIIRISKPYPGSRHDFDIRKSEKPIAKNIRIYADRGYQGLQNLNPQACIPFKRSKLKKLNSFQKQFNRELSRKRVKVENVIGDMKRHKILQERYRNKRESYHIKTIIIAGIVNLKRGF